MKWRIAPIVALFVVTAALSLTGCGGVATAAKSLPDNTEAQSNGGLAEVGPEGNAASPNTNTTDSEAKTVIAEGEAKATALSHAGLTESEVNFTKVYLDRDDGRLVYEVDFFYGTTEYDYDIDALNGTVLSYDIDYKNAAPAAKDDSVRQTEVVIDEAVARATAIAKVPGATEANIHMYLDYDDGRPVYEGIIVYGELKYEFEISATDGAIVDWDVESVYDD